MNDKIKQLIQDSGKYMFTAVVALIIVQVMIFVGQQVFHFSSFYIVLISSLMPTIAYMVMKENAEDAHKKMGMGLVKLSLVLALILLLNHFIIAILAGIGASGFGMLKMLLIFLVAIIAYATYNNDKAKYIFEKMEQESLFSLLKNGKEPDYEPQVGDIRVGVNDATKKPIYWRKKDRFLHMLILGPTGSGKTSQTIIPFINQDMQNLEAGITVIEPKGDLAEKIYSMAEHYGRKAVYFNPILPNCPYFNPLYGKEADVIENMSMTFKMLSADSPQFFLNMNDDLIRKSLKVLKRLYGNNANFIEFSRLIQNSGGLGKKMVQQFSRLPADTPDMAKENADITAWFLSDYFAERSKTYEHCSDIRSTVSKIISNHHLRRVLNPPNGENDIDFDKHLEEGGVITIATAQGELQDLSKFLGYFIILQFQSSVFRRPGNENTRREHYLYIDEFQTYANSGFANMLTQGRSYRVASHLATQNRALIGINSGKDAKTFIELVSTNARNLIIYPGGNALDADYYSKQFGEIMKVTTQVGVTRQKFNILKGIKPMSYDSESIREVEEVEARFSPTDIMYLPFRKITYCLIENNSIGVPGVAEIEFIPEELNEKLDIMVEEYKAAAFATEAEKPVSELEMKIDSAPDVVEDVVVKKDAAKPRHSMKEDFIVNPLPHVDETEADFIKRGKEEKQERMIDDDSDDKDPYLTQTSRSNTRERDLGEEALQQQRFIDDALDLIEEDDII
ncbi:type IV secretory system conjugative DNA transfer family protein [Lysinibacillus sphaericus]|uniref:type IV secretory system conjugative DNA transfer family protein n=1 Tax=Lysinibacillus sphaericus TaxID=1421 RepID=UPI001F512854|nr:type IV secretory system conjugative DNA transfer family protein [Lysinibacillus sphaericus]